MKPATVFFCIRTSRKMARRLSGEAPFGVGRSVHKSSTGNSRTRNSESSEAMIMNENRTIHLVDIPIGGKDGFIWNRLHEEREDLCEALLQERDDKESLHARLRKVDDALDRLMSGSYGNCSNCGHSIDDTKLAI